MGILTAMTNLLWDKAERGRPVHLGELRSMADTPADVARAWYKADELGVPVHGYLTYEEQQELNKIVERRIGGRRLA